MTLEREGGSCVGHRGVTAYVTSLPMQPSSMKIKSPKSFKSTYEQKGPISELTLLIFYKGKTKPGRD